MEDVCACYCRTYYKAVRLRKVFSEHGGIRKALSAGPTTEAKETYYRGKRDLHPEGAKRRTAGCATLRSGGKNMSRF